MRGRMTASENIGSSRMEEVPERVKHKNTRKKPKRNEEKRGKARTMFLVMIL